MQPVVITDDLVAAATGGDQACRERLLEAMTPQVRIMINARLNPTAAQVHLAEDLLQESMLSLSAGVATLERRTVAGLRAFASTIVARRVADAIRQKKRINPNGPVRSLDSTIHTDLSAAGPLWAFLSAGAPSPLSQANQADLFQRVMQALEGMKLEHRTVITLAFFDQLDTRDIAERMEISRAAASMLLIRAVKSLRRNLTGTSQIMAAPHEQHR